MTSVMRILFSHCFFDDFFYEFHPDVTVFSSFCHSKTNLVIEILVILW